MIREAVLLVVLCTLTGATAAAVTALVIDAVRQARQTAPLAASRRSRG